MLRATLVSSSKRVDGIIFLGFGDNDEYDEEKIPESHEEQVKNDQRDSSAHLDAAATSDVACEIKTLLLVGPLGFGSCERFSAKASLDRS